MDSCKSSSIPIGKVYKLTKKDCLAKGTEKLNVPYGQAIASSMRSMFCTNPH